MACIKPRSAHKTAGIGYRKIRSRKNSHSLDASSMNVVAFTTHLSRNGQGNNCSNNSATLIYRKEIIFREHSWLDGDKVSLRRTEGICQQVLFENFCLILMILWWVKVHIFQPGWIKRSTSTSFTFIFSKTISGTPHLQGMVSESIRDRARVKIE